MKLLNLVVPGLLGPFAETLPDHLQQNLLQVEFKQLNTFLSRANVSSSQASSFYETLVELIYPQCTQSLCQLTAEHDGMDISEGYFYRADPVHFKAESDHAILLGTELLDVQHEEAKQLIECFNQHFANDNLSLHFSHEARWYLKTDRLLNLQFNALDYSLGRDIKHFMPSNTADGADALWWRKMLNEAQMLFFQHEANQQRESDGRLAINGLWLWDIHFESQVDSRVLAETIFTDNELAIALGKKQGMVHSSIESISNINSSSLVVHESLYESVCYGDMDAWVKALKEYCKTEFQQVANLLSSNKVDEINIYPCNGQVFNIRRMNLLKFWKPVNYFKSL